MDFNLVSNFLTQTDNVLQKEALTYFETLKNDPNGWKLCLEALVNSHQQQTHQLNESRVFFCLLVIEDYIKSRYESDVGENQGALRQFLFSWFTSIPFTSIYILNKFAYIVNSLFLADFPERRWNSFFHDFLTLCQTQQNCDLFLRILLQINADVADREIPRTAKENERNNMIKDMMRETCLIELAQFWFNVINTYRENCPELVCLCLNVIGAYVAWIDITLITNEHIMSNLFNLFSKAEFRCSVCDCFTGILHKGMEPLAKTQLIEQFMNVEAIKGKLSQVGSLSATSLENEKENKEFLVKLSRLLNTIGIELLDAFKKVKPKQCAVNSSSQDTVQLVSFISTAIERKLGILCQFLSDKCFLVSIQVHPFAREYIQWIKNNRTAKVGDNMEMEMKWQEAVVVLLKIVISKSKYPADYDFEDDEETEFDECRKSCKTLFENLMFLNPSVCLNFVCSNLIQPVLTNWRGANHTFSDIEVALYFFYLIGENLNIITDQKRTEDLLQLLITSSVSTFPHSSVQTMYFELILRYEKYFAQSLNFLVPQILISFLDERGFKNADCKLRSRVSHIFNKFVKSHIKSKGNEKLQSFAEDIMKRLQDFLKLDITETPPDEEGKRLKRAPTIFDEVKYYITEEDQLLVYETVSVLIVCNQNFDPVKKQFLLKSLLLEPIWVQFEQTYGKIQSKLAVGTSAAQFASKPLSNGSGLTNGSLGTMLGSDNYWNHVKALCGKMSHYISLVARTSKAFSNVHTIKSINAQAIYLDSFNLFVKGLTLNVNEECLALLQSSVRQLLHRLIVCLEEAEIVPLLPIAIESIFLPASNLNGKTIQELVPLINQVVTKFKHSWMFQRDLMPFLLHMFMPLISSIFALISETGLPLDERHALQKSYYSFLSVLASNNVMDVFLNLEPSVLEQILVTVVQGAVEFPDLTTQKSCFVVLKKLIECISSSGTTRSNGGSEFGKSGAVPSASPPFVEFMYKSILPACFYAPLRQQEDNHQLVNECIGCLRAIQGVRGNDEFCSYLGGQFIPEHFPGFAQSNEMVGSFTGNDAKPLKSIFKAFVQQFKSNEIT